VQKSCAICKRGEQVKSSQIKSNQVKSSQIKSSQIKSSQIKSSQNQSQIKSKSKSKSNQSQNQIKIKSKSSHVKISAQYKNRVARLGFSLFGTDYQNILVKRKTARKRKRTHGGMSLLLIFVVVV
jgi:hypothetical protein